MTSEQIEKFIESSSHAGSVLNISFKDRQPVTGIFIQMHDYSELKSKNLWRVVRESHLEEWEQTHNPHLNRIFNGMSFTKLAEEHKKPARLGK